jgi:putative tryptophan/tyrosine transport system substrate-binding protein
LRAGRLSQNKELAEVSMRRREFITLLGGAVALPLSARAQHSRRVHRVGVIVLYRENDREGQLRVRAFQEGLEQAGWSIGTDLVIDVRWGVGDINWIGSTVTEMMQLAPEVILANSDQVAQVVKSASQTIPAVFIGASDQVAEGFVQSLAHPSGNMTGFTVQEPSLGPKWIDLLKELAPQLTRIVVLFNSENSGSVLVFRSCADAADKLGVKVVAATIREAAEVEAAFEMIAKQPNAGFVLPPDPAVAVHRKLIIELAARYRVPGIYGYRSFVADGGLISYGTSFPEIFRQAAGYVDRILRGAKPEDLPVQRPTKFELTINLKTAKTLSFDVPATLLARADEVFE